MEEAAAAAGARKAMAAARVCGAEIATALSLRLEGAERRRRS